MLNTYVVYLFVCLFFRYYKWCCSAHVHAYILLQFAIASAGWTIKIAGSRDSHILKSNRYSQIACFKKRREKKKGGQIIQPSFIYYVRESFCLQFIGLYVCFFFCVLTGYWKGVHQKRLDLCFGMWTPHKFNIVRTIESNSRNSFYLPGGKISQCIYCHFSRGNYFDTYLLFYQMPKINTYIFWEILNRNWRIRQVKVDSSNSCLFLPW